MVVKGYAEADGWVSFGVGAVEVADECWMGRGGFVNEWWVLPFLGV
jgi:hypothetical protein